jgi:hypothetical protein
MNHYSLAFTAACRWLAAESQPPLAVGMLLKVVRRRCTGP